jgi:hypothetical protein
MTQKCHVRFLGEGVVATPPPYPTTGSQTVERACQRLLRTAPAGPNVSRPEQDVPVPNHREVYSQTYPATPFARGVEC